MTEDENGVKVEAHGDDPRIHFIRDGRFVCEAAPTARCRNYPGCECEGWDPDLHGPIPAEGHEDVPHDECWIAPWMGATDLRDSFITEEVMLDDDEFPDGPVVVIWQYDYLTWEYDGERIPARHSARRPGCLRSPSAASPAARTGSCRCRSTAASPASLSACRAARSTPTTTATGGSRPITTPAGLRAYRPEVPMPEDESEQKVERAAEALRTSRLTWGVHADRWGDEEWQREFWTEAATVALTAAGVIPPEESRPE